MPKRPDFILQISIRNIEDFSPGAIIRSPRTFRPMDVQNACANLNLEASKGTPEKVLTVANYILSEYFALSHSSGLYNRQIKLWEAITRTSKIDVFQASKGFFFSSEKQSDFDLMFIDHKNRPIILAHFLLPEAAGDKFDYLNSYREFIKRASQYQGLHGLFLCYPSPFPAKLLEHIKKETNARDAIARYESLLPKLGISINLIEVDRTPIYNPAEQAESHKIRLVHPDLTKKKLGSQHAMPGADMSKLDQGLPEDDEELN